MKEKRCSSIKHTKYQVKQAVTKDHTTYTDMESQNKPRNSKQRLTIPPSSMSKALNKRQNTICSMQFAIMATSCFLSYLSYNITLLRRRPLKWSGVYTMFYKGFILTCAVSVIEAQSSSVQSSSVIGPSNTTNTVILTTSTPFIQNMTSLHITPSSIMHSVNTSVNPSPTLSQSSSLTSSSDVNLTPSRSVVNMTSIYNVMTSPSVNTIMTSSVETSHSTSLSTSSSAYHVNGTSVIDVVSSASYSVSSSTAMIQENRSTTMVNASTVVSEPDPTSVTTLAINSSTPAMADSTVTDIHGINMTSTSVVLSTLTTTPIIASFVNETMSVTPVHLTSSVYPTATTAFVTATTSMTYNNASSKTIKMNISTPSSTILNQVSSSYVNTSSVIVRMNATTPTSTMSGVSTSYINASSATVQMNASTPSSTILSVVSTSYTNASSVTAKINATAPTWTMSSVVSTSYTNASSVTAKINVTTPSSTMLSEVSTSYTNASSVTAKINATTPSSTMLSEVFTSYNNASSVAIQMNVTTPITSIFSSVTSSMSYVNASMTSTLLPSSSILNGSSVFTILPSTPWPSTLATNHSSVYSTMSLNISVTSSVNHTSKSITPNMTMMVMNSSSSAFPTTTPTPIPYQGLVSYDVHVTIVNRDFTSDLNDKNSSAYKDLKSKAENVFGAILAPLPAFVRVEILNISQGSVVITMKTTFNASTNVTTTKIKETIIANNASKNTQNFIFSQALSVKGECTPSFCVNGGTCKTNVTIGAFCTCRSGFNGVRCDKVVVNGSYSSWSPFSECSKSCKGGKMHRKRTCTNPPPQNGGRDCSGLGPDYEEKDCNSDVLCPVIWIIIGVCCAVFLILLILLIVCCLKRKKKEKEQRSPVAGSQMNIVPLEIMVCDFDLPTARRKSPDGTSNPEFVNESETEEDDIYKKQLLLFLKQSHLIKPGMNLSFGDDISDTSDYSNANSRKVSVGSTEHDEMEQHEKPRLTSEL